MGPVEEPELTLSNQTIPATKNVKYLGVIVDEYLNYSVHNQKQGAKLKKQFGYIYRQLRRCISRQSMVYLFSTLIRVSLLYACEAVYPTNKTDCKTLERVQKYACRLITGNYDYGYSYDAMLSDLNMQSLWTTVFTKKLTMIHNYISGYRYCAPGLITLLRDVNTRSSSRTNHDNAISIPSCTYSTLFKSPLITSSVAYNFVPSNLVHLNKQQFKNAISKNSFVTYILSKIKGLRSQIIYKIDL